MAAMCPVWCEGIHPVGVEHSSRTIETDDVLVEVVQLPGDDTPYISFLEADEGGNAVQFPLVQMPDLIEAIGALYPHEPRQGRSSM